MQSDESIYDWEARLDELTEELDLLTKSLETVDHDCSDHLELRTIVVKGGGKQIANQCLVCGERKGNAISRSSIMELTGGIEPPAFDTSIAQIWDEKHCQLVNERHKVAALRDEAHAKVYPHFAYTVSDDFKKKQESLRELEKNRLEEIENGFKLALDNLNSEIGEKETIQLLIKETISRKKKLYEERKKTIERFYDEVELKQWLIENLKPDFHIYQEVAGVHEAEGIDVRIDFVLYPRDHLIEEGFAEQPFGIEVKYFNQDKGFTHKTSRGIWQAISYNDCLFKIREKEFKIKFCLIFSNLSFEKEKALIKNFGHEGVNDQVEWRGMLHIANHARVGELTISGDKNKLRGWGMRFAGSVYFSCSYYNDKYNYSLSTPSVIEKVQIGNF
ncbi:hypothetical protein [Marinomonas fungiae]|uniref:hypothetical protein n=1 Tax=Marinomonas fungiae TaxID=1137284 RepID=UPI003A94F6A7